MLNIKEFIHNIKKNTIKENKRVESIKDVNYLIECINTFVEQMKAQEYCTDLLQQLSSLDGHLPMTDSMIEQFKEIIKKVTLRATEIKELYYETTSFQRACALYSNYATARLEKDGSYSITPIVTKDKLIDYVQQFFLSNPKENILDALNRENAQTHDKLLHSKINTYYGDLKFIKERTKCIIDAIKMIRDHYQLLPHEFQLIEMKIIEAEELNERINSVGNVIIKEDRFGDHVTNLTQDEYFDVVSPSFKQLVEIEEELSFVSQRIWENYFTQRGAKFVHALSGGIVESDRMQKICATLYMDDLATIPYGHTGYEYGVSMKNIDCICEQDVGSWRISKKRFLEQGISHAWQWNEETCMFYEFGYYSKLLPPDYIEMKARNYNQGNKSMSYTEILLLNNQTKIQPIKAFCTDMASEEEIRLITQMAELQGIEVEYIDTKAIKAKMESKGLS